MLTNFNNDTNSLDTSASPAQRTIFVSGLNYSTSQRQISDFFNDCGGIELIKVPKYKGTENNTGYCHITFTTVMGQYKALSRCGNYLDGRFLDIQPAKGPQNLPKVVNLEQIKSLAIAVKNQPYDCSIQDISQFFTKCGSIVDIKMIFKQQKKFTGYAYVTFQEIVGVQNALLLSGHPLNGRFLKIHNVPSVPKTDDVNIDICHINAIEKNYTVVNNKDNPSTRSPIKTNAFNENNNRQNVRLMNEIPQKQNPHYYQQAISTPPPPAHPNPQLQHNTQTAINQLQHQQSLQYPQQQQWNQTQQVCQFGGQWQPSNQVNLENSNTQMCNSMMNYEYPQIQQMSVGPQTTPTFHNDCEYHYPENCYYGYTSNDLPNSQFHWGASEGLDPQRQQDSNAQILQFPKVALYMNMASNQQMQPNITIPVQVQNTSYSQLNSNANNNCDDKRNQNEASHLHLSNLHMQQQRAIGLEKCIPQDISNSYSPQYDSRQTMSDELWF